VLQQANKAKSALLGALLLLRWKFDYFAALVLGDPLYALNELVGHAKLDDLGHSGLLVRTVCAY
jgi:hypothetical protein